MKKKYLLLALPAVIILLIYLHSWVKPPESCGPVTLVIPENATSKEVGEILQNSGLIKSPLVFRLYTRYRGVDARLRAGEYNFLAPVSLPELVNQLVKGRPEIVRVTIPEGFTLEQIAALLAEKDLVDEKAFLREAAQGNHAYPFCESLPLKDSPAGSKRLEGYLFPDTYYLSKKMAPAEIIDLMLKRFQQEMDALDYGERAGRAGLTLGEAVIIASLVEKEARIDEERPVIAGVILNRLQKGMPLQIDATVQYALGGEYRPQLLYKDLEVDSPYNTYKISGLPPAPIASPGRSSLLAAVTATAQDTGYLYFVAKPDGTHAFARTLAEHNANKRKYQQAAPVKPVKNEN